MATRGWFEQTYPALSRWVQGAGWLELGRVDWSPSWLRVLDEGGLVWEGGTAAETLSAALAEAEAAVAQWFRANSRPR
jgi:hypothetical protein